MGLWDHLALMFIHHSQLTKVFFFTCFYEKPLYANIGRQEIDPKEGYKCAPFPWPETDSVPGI